jgi:phospholipase/carboxylesterase
MLLIPESITLGGLDCLLFAPKEARAEGLGVFCHGFGAPGDDLVPLGAEILSGPGTDSLALLFPAAPVSLADKGMPGGRAWWSLDINRLQTGSPLDAAEMAGREPPGSAGSAASLCEAVTTCSERLDLVPEQVVLGGFSQGAMVAADCAFRSGVARGGLCFLSGAPLNLGRWRLQAEALSGRSVMQTHGTMDPILPYNGAEMVRDTLTAAGMKVEFRSFIGGHTIPSEVLTELPGFLRSACGLEGRRN